MSLCSFWSNANYPVVTKSYLIKQVFWLIPLIAPSQLSPVAKSAINFNRTYSCEYSSGFSPGFPFNSVRRFDWKLDWCKVNGYFLILFLFLWFLFQERIILWSELYFHVNQAFITTTNSLFPLWIIAFLNYGLFSSHVGNSLRRDFICKGTACVWSSSIAFTNGSRIFFTAAFHKSKIDFHSPPRCRA